MKKRSSAEKKQYACLFVLLALVVILIGVLTVLCMPFFNKLSDPVYQQKILVWAESLGIVGWLFLLGIQMLQIIVAFIPGGPVQILTGVLYGAWGGLATCLLGIVIASSIIFFTVRRFGTPLLVRILGQKKLDEFDFLNNTEKIETVTFILFLLPGMPKDTLTYLAGVSKIKASHFLFLSTFARIPSLIGSTFMGATMSRGNWLMTLVIFLLTAAVGITGILYKNKIIDRFHEHHNKRRKRGTSGKSKQ